MLDHLQLEKYLIREALSSFDSVWTDIISCEPEEREKCLADTGYSPEIVGYVLKGILAEFSLGIESIPKRTSLQDLIRQIAIPAETMTATVTETRSITAPAHKVKCPECDGYFSPAGLGPHLGRHRRELTIKASTPEIEVQALVACDKCSDTFDDEIGLRIHRRKAHGT